MSEEAQRIAIAKACGWTSKKEGNDSFRWYTEMPDYLSDLNAMHEAEGTLKDDQWDDYEHYLSQLVPQRWNCGPALESDEDVMIHTTFDLLHATAAQRAEAFLRTLSLWEEATP